MGVIMYTLLIGRPPFETSSVKTTYKRIQTNTYQFPSSVSISNAARQLIIRILSPNPKDRPSLDEIMNDDFFHQCPFPASIPDASLVEPLRYYHSQHPSTHHYDNTELDEELGIMDVGIQTQPALEPQQSQREGEKSLDKSSSLTSSFSSSRVARPRQRSVLGTLGPGIDNIPAKDQGIKSFTHTTGPENTPKTQNGEFIFAFPCSFVQCLI
jgi:serine/threonine protein kinase